LCRSLFLPCTAFLIGINTLLTQLGLIRELALIFAGNEIFLGITLAYWVGGTGLGAGWVAQKYLSLSFRSNSSTLAGLAIISTIFFPSSILITRIFYHWLSASGIEPGLGTMFLICAILIIPPAMVNGLWYAVLLAVAEKSRASLVSGRCFSPGVFFSIEALGAGLAGIGYTFLFAQHWYPFQIAANLLLFHAIYAFLLLRSWQPDKKARWLPAAVLVILCLTLLFHVIGGWTKLGRYSKSWYPFPGEQLINHHTPRGHLALIRQADTFSYFYSGKFIFSFPDPHSNEPQVFLPFLLYPQAKQIAVVGNNPEVISCLCAIAQVQKIVLYIEDQAAHYTFCSSLPPAWKKVFNNKKIKFFFGDFRQLLRQQSEIYDIIILSLAPPSNLSANRFYTVEYMRELKSHLSAYGIIMYALDFSPNRSNWSESRFICSLLKTLQVVFPQTRIFPIDRLYLCASCKNPLRTISISRLQTNFQQLFSARLHYRVEQIPIIFDPAREKEIQLRFTAQKQAINSDYRPQISGLYSLYWLSQHSGPATGISILVIVLLILLAIRKTITKKIPSPLLIITMTGAAIMSLQLCTITAFQAAQGNLWREIGLLFSGMMAGLALGGIGGEFLQNRFLMRLSIASILACLCATSYFIVFKTAEYPGVAVVMLLLGGTCGGLLYAMITRNETADTAAQAWAADLIGSFWGALFTGTFFIPLLGLGAGFLFAVSLLLSAALSRGPLARVVQTTKP